MPAIGGHFNLVALSRPRGGRLAIGEGIKIKTRGLQSLAARFSVALPYCINITSRVTNQAKKFRRARNIKLHYELNNFWEVCRGCVAPPPHAQPAGSRPGEAPACRRAACASGSGPSARVETHAGRTLRR